MFRIKKTKKEEKKKKETPNVNVKKRKLTFRKKAPRTPKRKLFPLYLKRAGYDFESEEIRTKINKIILILTAIVSLAFLIFNIIEENYIFAFLVFVVIWTIFLGILYLITWLAIYLFLDYRMYKRTVEIEDVLPDFLQLTAANINAGMTIDKALWYAVRPKFGILAKEIEEVAKNTMTGEDLKKSLKEFSDRYNSKTLERSINLLLEGLDSGGQMADLLNKVAINIKEGKILKKEMSADVTTYVIFITFASIVGAPALLGLSTNLLMVIQTMVGGIDIGTQVGSASFIDLNANAIALSDFRIFVFIMLFITSLFSSFIISTIKKGNIKEGLRYIPIFIISTFALYYLSYYIISLFTSALL